MVLTKKELIAALQKEVGILVHLAQKLDEISTHYRPTAKQRSSLELLRYLSVMGPVLVQSTKDGGFDPAVWKARTEAANALDLDGVIAALEEQKETHAELLHDMTDEDFRAPIQMFRSTSSKGAVIVNLVLGGRPALRAQPLRY